jgi:hypothetical protein
MRHVEHNNRMVWSFDPVPDAPLLPSASGVLASVFIMEGVADSERIVEKRADDELGNRRGNLLRKARDLALRTRTHIEAPESASFCHAAPVLRNR